VRQRGGRCGTAEGFAAQGRTVRPIPAAGLDCARPVRYGHERAAVGGGASLRRGWRRLGRSGFPGHSRVRRGRHPPHQQRLYHTPLELGAGGGGDVALFLPVLRLYAPQFDPDTGRLQPLWVWVDYLSVPQRSWASQRKFNPGELAVRERLNGKYIQFIGLEFGRIATDVQAFVSFVPMLFEFEGDVESASAGGGDGDAPLGKLAQHLRDFGMSPTFHLTPRAKVLAESGTAWGPLRVLTPGFQIWQDQSYVQRIW
jgi:hypothetical protein